MLNLNYLIILLVVFILGGFLGWFLHRFEFKGKAIRMREEAQSIIRQAREEARNIRREAVLQAKDKFYKMKSEFEAEIKEKRKELQRFENRLIQKEEQLDAKLSMLEKRNRH